MRHTVKSVWIVAILVLAAMAVLAETGAAPVEGHGSIVIIFTDGHQQTLSVDEIARIDFKTPFTIVFKDGRQQSVPAADLARIDFQTAASASSPSRNHFVGKWEVGQGNGSTFYITLEASGQARKSIGASHGTWILVDGEARISWDDGWHDAIRKVGAKHEKFAYGPGKSFDDKPSNVTAARNTQAKPI